MSTTIRSIPPAAGEAAHTPTPWKAVMKAIIERPIMVREHVAIIPNGGPSIAYLTAGTEARVDIQLANAAFIVRACNSHAALVEALRDALRFGTNMPPGVQAQARAALQLDKQ